MRYRFIGVPMSCGSPYPGTELACKAFSEQDFKDIIGGDDYSYTEVACSEPDGSYPKNLIALDAVMNCCREIYGNVAKAYDEGEFPVVIGGDHALSIGSIAASYEKFQDELCVVWIDAHTDINTEMTTESGYIHGMPIAASMGICCDELTAGREKARVKGENVFIIGARSIDKGEYDIIEENNVNLYTMEEIREKGLENVMERVSEKLRGKKVHLSLDVDFFDPSVFYATGYNIDEGFSLSDAESIISDIFIAADPVLFECVEYSPAKDADGEDFIKLKKILKDTLRV